LRGFGSQSRPTQTDRQLETFAMTIQSVASIPLKPMTHIPPSFPTPSFPPLPFPSLHSLRSRHTLMQRGLGSAVRSQAGQRGVPPSNDIWCILGWKMLLVRAILTSLSRVTKNMFVFGIWMWFCHYLLAFRPLLSKAVNRLPRIYNNKLKFPPFGVFLFPPYFTHDPSCVMLNIDWTPLIQWWYTPGSRGLPIAVDT